MTNKRSEFIKKLFSINANRLQFYPGQLRRKKNVGASETNIQLSEQKRHHVKLQKVLHEDGRISQYPPATMWDDWEEWDGSQWPKRKKRSYSLIPTICFNCESACGLLAYIDKESHQVKKFEGNPHHPGSRGRNCAKGPATLNQILDPERILYPLKRVGKRGEGKWKRISWLEALGEIGEKMRNSREKRPDGIMYHVGRPGEDHYTNRCIQAWGVDGHNSHTNICSAAARAGYTFWAGFDRPSPDHANARVILLISSHLETGHYFNPHAQRIIEGKMDGAKLITFDPRLSNTAAKSDLWIPSWPGSEAAILLAIANYLITNGLYDREFVKKWVNWEDFLQFLSHSNDQWTQEKNLKAIGQRQQNGVAPLFEDFEEALRILYQPFTFDKAGAEAQVDPAMLRQAAEWIASCDGKLAAHTWRSASIGNLGGWQVARCLFFLNVLTGSVGKIGGTFGNSWNKFVPAPFSSPPPGDHWNDLLLPQEWPLAFYEMSFLLPHFLEEKKGTIDVYFTRVYNPMWINPDGFMWLKSLRDEEKIKTHVALTPTWNETAWFADYVLPMGHASERHDLMSQETHNGKWIGFRQPVSRVFQEKQGKKVRFTYETNPGEVWEEAEFWVELAGSMDPDGRLGVRQWFESPYRKGELISQDEYWGWIFDHSVPGLPEAAAQEGLSPLAYMKKYGCFEIQHHSGEKPFERLQQDTSKKGVMIDNQRKVGFSTPSGKLEFFSDTLWNWGWKDKEYCLPWYLKSHVHPDEIDRQKGEMVLLPNFRLPTLIHTRSANCKWLYEISHRNPIWMNPVDAERLGVLSEDLVRVDTEIGYFIDSVWVTEGMKPGIIAMSHHLGRWRLEPEAGVSQGMSNHVSLEENSSGEHTLTVKSGGRRFRSSDPDTERIWWQDVGVHQNLTHGVHPDPVSGAHCWLQKACSVRKALPTEKHGTVFVDTKKSMDIYRQWLALTKPAITYSPDGLRRPLWLKRPLKPTVEAYQLPRNRKS